MALLSCINENKNDEGINVQIINNADTKLDSVKLYTYTGNYFFCDSLLIEDINPKTDNTQWYGLRPCNSDGAFLIKAFLNGNTFEQGYGYFTNGMFLDDKITISIDNDSLFITSVTSIR